MASWLHRLPGAAAREELLGLVDQLNADPAVSGILVQLPLPGELLYFYDEGRGAVGGRKAVGEICVVYGRGVVLRGHEGVPCMRRCSLASPAIGNMTG